MKKLIMIIALVMCWSATTIAQDNEDFGLWNDVQISHAINKQVDVVGGVRFDTKNNTTSFAEERVYGGVNWKSKNGRFTVQPWVVFLKNFSRTPYYEVRPQVTLGYKFTTVNSINITPKVRVEYHLRHNVRDQGRAVPLVTFDKKLSKNYGVFQTTEFWIPINNSADRTKYRQRYFFGVNRVINKKASVDIFYLYQRDEQVAPQHNHKIGLTWKIKV